MWLVVVMPDVSQIVASLHAREPVAELCSGSTASDHAAAHPMGSLARCGYCDLLHVHTALASVAISSSAAQMRYALASAEPSREVIGRLDGWRPDLARAPPVAV